MPARIHLKISVLPKICKWYEHMHDIYLTHQTGPDAYLVISELSDQTILDHDFEIDISLSSLFLYKLDESENGGLQILAIIPSIEMAFATMELLEKLSGNKTPAIKPSDTN